MREVPNSVSVIVIGAGFGGLCMAVALKKAGVTFTVFEKGHEVGGIWRDNTYPGSGCDVPSHLYSFSFQKYRSSVVRYPGQEQILEYLRTVTHDHDLRPHLRTNTEIVSATYDKHRRKWTVITTAGEEHTADVVVTAVGQLHRPKLPDIPGRELFTGPAFHTTDWPADLDLTGLRVAIVGTGSSAAQLLPIVARQARRVDVYQRTANWVIPKPRAEFGALTRWVLRRLPFLHTVYRSLTYLVADTVLSPVIRRGWSFRPASWLARRHLRRQVPDPALRAKLTRTIPSAASGSSSTTASTPR